VRIFRLEAEATGSRLVTGHGVVCGVTRRDAFEAVRVAGLSLPDLEAGTRYDGSPVLKAGGCFVAGLASHRSAEPGSLVVRADLDERDGLLEDAPEVYYLTDYYRRHPVVLARLSRLDRAALRDLLSLSLRLTRPRMKPARKRTPRIR